MCICFELQLFSKVDTWKVEPAKMEGEGRNTSLFSVTETDTRLNRQGYHSTRESPEVLRFISEK